jgi:hypothetical protein
MHSLMTNNNLLLGDQGPPTFSQHEYTSAGQGYTRRVQGLDSYPYPSRVWI